MKRIEEVVKNNKCTGCSGCLNICPTSAITMESNSEGFFVPHIDKEACINCGLCNLTCPALNNINTDEQYLLPEVYAGWNKDERIRLQSSSGGVFSVLAEYIIEKRGYVCGAVIDKDNKLKHIIVSSKIELKQLRGSKYYQSELGNSYKEIKKLLEQNKWVLFSGTPCQAAGLRSYLKKEYSKLLVVDIVCHGAPSPLVFRKYLKEIENTKNKQISKINFRDKSTGWKNYSFTLSNDQGNVLNEKFNENVFFEGFLKNLYLNKICTSCPYSQFPKYSDITLGDYWGIEYYDKKLDDEKGVSVIIINNKKGKEFVSFIKDRLFLKKIDRDNGNNKLTSISVPCDSHVNRDMFFQEMSESKKPISNIIEKYLTTNNTTSEKNIAIFNMRLPTNNFGAILQSYALSEVVKNLGYNPVVINYISKDLEAIKDRFSLLNLDKFRENYIQYTLPCYTNKDLIKLNENFNTFIVGSDQVWNYNYVKGVFSEDIGKYFLNFVLPTKKIISYAASFAENHWKGTSEEIEIVKNSLKRFTAVSVREKSGVNICKELFDTQAECVLDPTLLLDVTHYQSIIDSERLNNKNDKYIAYFTLDENLEKNIGENKKLEKYCKDNNVMLENIRGNIKNILGETKFIYNSIPAWLNLIKNSDFIISDSYHCVIFSILFNKQFVFIQREYAGNERLNSLFSLLSIKNRFLESIKEVNMEDITNRKIDYSSINKKLNIEKRKSIEFLDNSLKKNYDPLKNISILERDFIQEKTSNIDYQTKTEEQTIQIQSLESMVEERDLQNSTLLNKANLLESGMEEYRNSKTLKYAAVIKGILYKMGFKRYKV